MLSRTGLHIGGAARPAAALLAPLTAAAAASARLSGASAACSAIAVARMHHAARHATMHKRLATTPMRALHSVSSVRSSPRLQLSTPPRVRFFSSSPSSSNPSNSHNSYSTQSSSSSSSPSSAPTPFVPVTPVLSPVETFGTKGARLWGKVKAEARHYWLGTKLLSREVRLASKMCLMIARGHEMSRRERRQLQRTSADLVRMVPFIVILVIPFAEFALPILLKFFPNMLPSTYLDSTGREAKLQKQLLVKMEMARFLQETTHLLAQQIAAAHPAKKGDGTPLSEIETAANARSFRDFMAKVRLGQKVNNGDILAFTKLFDSELTLDNLDQKQLEAMCRLLDIKVFGSVWVLRYKLEQRLLAIQKDDLLIQKDGIDALNDAELAEACRARGIFTGRDSAYLRRKLGDWLELSLEHKVPLTLLLLSRAFSRQMTGAYEHGLAGEEADKDLAEDLATTLAHVPEVAVADAEKEIADRSDDRETRLQQLEEEAVTAAFEELQASKKGGDGKSRAAKLQKVKPALGVTAERLARMEAANDDVENIIDTTIAQEEKKKEKKVEPSVAAAAAVAAEAASAAPAKPVAAATATPTVATTATPTAAPVAATPDAVTAPTSSAAAAPPAAADEAAAELAKDAKDARDAKDSKKKKKTIAVVDKLNDSVGAMIDEIKEQAEELEKAMAGKKQ